MKRRQRTVVGWREWLGLPELGIELLKGKFDTGARTSALHAFNLERFELDGAPWVRFVAHPLQRDAITTVEIEAPLVDHRHVRSSSGKSTVRPVIETQVVLGPHRWRIELTLVRRDFMGFRMLVGRQAMRKRFVVDPGRSYLVGPRPAKRKWSR